MGATVNQGGDVAGALADVAVPPAGSPAELRAFAQLQQRLTPMFMRVFSDRRAPRTVVVVPSMSLDHEELAKLAGASRYEERFLCLLMLLRLPATRVVYITSEPVASTVVDYYLRLVRDVDPRDARSRLTMLDCGDASPAPLTEKILARPELIARIRALLDDPTSAHITCFTASTLERTLALRLGIPLYGADPALGYLGTKSGSRDVFHQAGVPTPPGFEHLRGEDDVVRALAHLKRQHPTLERAVIKLEEGFSGEGNATFTYAGAPSGPMLERWVRDAMPSHVRCVAAGERWEHYRDELGRLGGIVEAFITGDEVRSPSVQCRIDPSGATQIISTHDQILGGGSGQVYLGCSFPAEATCCAGLHAAAHRVTDVLAADGVVGRFGIDFVSTRVHNEWQHYAIEINLRKGGTTHPFLTLQLLTDGSYDESTGLFHSRAGRPCFYIASDNLMETGYSALTPELVIAAAERAGLQYDHATERGIVFHMLGALADVGKVGVVCVGRTRDDARALFDATVALLDASRPRSDAMLEPTTPAPAPPASPPPRSSAVPAPARPPAPPS